MDIHIANEKEKNDIFDLRIEVFVNEQKVPREIELDEEDASATHIVAYKDGVCVGCGRIIIEGNNGHLGRFAVKKNMRSLGIGAKVCRFAIDYCIKNNCSRIWLNGQTQAKGFYEKLGFKPVGKTFFEAGIEHIQMEIVQTA